MIKKLLVERDENARVKKYFMLGVNSNYPSPCGRGEGGEVMRKQKTKKLPKKKP
jgi:hypothetical protein